MNVLTYNARRGRLRAGRLDALTRLWPSFGVPDGPVHPVALFGRAAPMVLEIGSGMGDATAAMAAADPGRDYLAVEVHTAGVANLLLLIDAAGLTNVRVCRGDAMALVRERLSPSSLDAIHVFFPDPWPKARHHKRRLIQPSRVAVFREALAPGGVLHCATDSGPYAQAMLETLSGDSGLSNTHDGFAPRPQDRPLTRYEQRGMAAGHPVYDIVFRRTGA